MFRMSTGAVHTWQDIAKNIGKLSLAGLFLGGSFFLVHAQAATVAHSLTVQPSPHETAVMSAPVPSP